jgi:hypothetical protein
MIRILILIVLLVSLSHAQERKFPLSQNNGIVYFNLLGSGNVLMSVNTILERIDNTYQYDRHTSKAKEGIVFCALDAGIDADTQVVTGVKLLTNSSGIVKLFLTLSTGKEYSISSSEIAQRKIQLAIALTPRE